MGFLIWLTAKWHHQTIAMKHALCFWLNWAAVTKGHLGWNLKFCHSWWPICRTHNCLMTTEKWKAKGTILSHDLMITIRASQEISISWMRARVHSTEATHWTCISLFLYISWIELKEPGTFFNWDDVTKVYNLPGFLIPHMVSMFPLGNESLLSTSPDFIQQVPPFSSVQEKWVQSKRKG